jgi:protein SCO1/2
MTLRWMLVALTLIASVAPARPAAADDLQPPGDVGVIERLGQTVPLDLTLRDEQGQPVKLGALIDRPTLLTLNYFRCAGICTPQLNSVAAMVNEIALEPGKDFRVLTVSFDERDTSEIAARKRQNYLTLMKRPVPPTAWRFLTGDAAATRALADAVGFKFQRQGEDFAHPGVIIVLSPTGHVTRYIHGVRYLPADVQMAVGEAQRGVARPAIAQLAAFCYRYDPAGRRYVLNVQRVVGVVTLAVGLAIVVLVNLGSRRTRSRGEGGQS